MLTQVHCFPYGYLAILAPSDGRIIDLELYSRVIWVDCWLRTLMWVFRSFLWGRSDYPEMSLLIFCLEGEDLMPVS